MHASPIGRTQSLQGCKRWHGQAPRVPQLQLQEDSLVLSCMMTTTKAGPLLPSNVELQKAWEWPAASLTFPHSGDMTPVCQLLPQDVATAPSSLDGLPRKHTCLHSWAHAASTNPNPTNASKCYRIKSLHMSGPAWLAFLQSKLWEAFFRSCKPALSLLRGKNGTC